MDILQTNSFKKSAKKLHKNQKEQLDEAVKEIKKNPNIGEEKVGDLSGISVYKFDIDRQLTLLAYSYDDFSITLTLLALGSHKNFYRDLKKH